MGFAVLPALGLAQDLPQPSPAPPNPQTGFLQQQIQDAREDNADLRRRLHELETRLTRMEGDIPHTEETLQARIDNLDQHLADRTQSLESNLTLYMRVGTLILILIGVFGFGYIHQILRGVIERSVNSHLRSEEFARNLGNKVEQVAEGSRESILEASKEETRQLTRKLIDEFLTEERSRIERAVEEEQDALNRLRQEHLQLQSPVPQEAGEYLEKVASAASSRSLELLTDEEVYYAMLEADSKGNHLDAERYARELLRRHPGTADSLANLAWILEHTDRFQEAEAHYKRALEADPGREDIACYYAYLLDGQDRWEEARELLRGILERHPDNPRAISQLANFLIRHDQLEEARQVLQRTATEPAGNRDLLVSWARLLAGEGLPDEALGCYRQALEKAPQDPELLAQTAWLELTQGELDAAEAHADSLAQIQGEDPETWRLQGEIHMAQGRFGDAESDFRQALSLADNSLPDLFFLGLALLGQGRRAEATEMYNQGMAMAEDTEQVEREAIEPLRRWSRAQTIPQAETFLEWLEAVRGDAGHPPGQGGESHS